MPHSITSGAFFVKRGSHAEANIPTRASKKRDGKDKQLFAKKGEARIPV